MYQSDVENIAQLVYHYRKLIMRGPDVITRKDHKIARKYLKLKDKDDDLWILDFLEVEFNQKRPI